MKTYYEQLRELISEVPEIKKDLEELRFGTKISRCGSRYSMLNSKEFFDEEKRILYTIEDRNFRTDKINKIGNNIEERHIRMYCKSKNIDVYIINNGDIIINDSYVLIDLDDTKSFHQQNEEVFKEFVEYLLKQ